MLYFFSSVSPLWDLRLPHHHLSSRGTPTDCSTVHKSQRTPRSTLPHWSHRSLGLLELVSVPSQLCTGEDSVQTKLQNTLTSINLLQGAKQKWQNRTFESIFDDPVAPLMRVPPLPFLTGSTLGFFGSDTGMTSTLSQSRAFASAFTSDTLCAFTEGKPFPGEQKLFKVYKPNDWVHLTIKCNQNFAHNWSV